MYEFGLLVSMLGTILLGAAAGVGLVIAGAELMGCLCLGSAYLSQACTTYEKKSVAYVFQATSLAFWCAGLLQIGGII